MTSYDLWNWIAQKPREPSGALQRYGENEPETTLAPSVGLTSADRMTVSIVLWMALVHG